MAIGTRIRALTPQLHQAGTGDTRSLGRDKGKSGDVTLTTPTFGLTGASATVATAGDGIASYVPGTDVLTVSAGFRLPASFDVTHTKVIAYTVADAGTGGTPGAATLTGTTGTGTKVQIACTIAAGGTIESLDSLTVAGDYTVNPTDVAAEPVTGGSLSGADIAVVMGVLTVALAEAGAADAAPANPVATTNSGSAAGAALNLTCAGAAGRMANDTDDFPVASGFAVPNLVRITGTNLNNGTFRITGIDATNHAYLVLDPAPKAETPASARVITV